MNLSNKKPDDQTAALSTAGIDWPLVIFFVLAYAIAWGAWHLPVLLDRDAVTAVFFLLLSFGLAFIFTWMFNGSGGSLVPGLLFHASQNWEEGFETLVPGLVGTDWELISTLALLVLGIIAGVVVWRSGRRVEVAQTGQVGA